MYCHAPVKTKMQNLSLSAVQTLFQGSLVKVVEHLPHYVAGLSDLPPNVKDRILYLMSKRGLITDANIIHVLHRHLKSLDLSDCDDITDRSLQSIASHCRLLQKLDLNCTKGTRTSVTSQGVTSLASSCPHLSIVSLRRCSAITDEAVVALSRHCPRLRDLNVGGCTQLTDVSLSALGQNSAALRSVNFGHAQVTDEGVLSLVCGSAGQSLKEMDMSHCTSLTDEAVEAVVQFCPHISIFIFSGCPQITDRSRLALEEIFHDGHSKMKQLTWTIY